MHVLTSVSFYFTKTFLLSSPFNLFHGYEGPIYDEKRKFVVRQVFGPVFYIPTRDEGTLGTSS